MFPVDIIGCKLACTCADHAVEESPAVYLAAVLEYLAMELLHLAGQKAADDAKASVAGVAAVVAAGAAAPVITLRCTTQALRQDVEFELLTSDCTILGAGFCPRRSTSAVNPAYLKPDICEGHDQSRIYLVSGYNLKGQPVERDIPVHLEEFVSFQPFREWHEERYLNPLLYKMREGMQTKTKFEMPPSFICPISHECMKDPCSG